MSALKIISEDDSSITSFYRNKSVFVTGATGFVGKVLVEKLLRSCEVDMIYILMRPKNEKTSKQRLNEFTNSKFFSVCNIKNIEDKLVAVQGDITSPKLGLSAEDRSMLIENVSIIFHSAASVKFDDPLDQCLQFNVLGTQSILELCHEIPNLDAFIHVSTAYAYCQKKVCEEVLYPMKATAKQVIEAVDWMDEHSLDTLCSKIFEGRPNTYTFTKALAEHYISEHRGTLPVAIARPSIVTGTWKEPVPGWVDSINGPGGVSLLGSLGIARIMDFAPQKKADMIPVDILVNALIAIAWYTKLFANNQLIIYNITSGNLNPIRWSQFLNFGREAAMEAPSMKVVRPPAKVATEEKIHPVKFLFIKWFSEIFFAYLIDTILTVLGYKRLLVKIVDKMHRGFDLLGYFALREWSFSCNNLLHLINRMSPEDRKEFCCDVREVDWRAYCHNFYMGIRRYLLKEDDSTIAKARQRFFLLKIGYTVFNYLLIFLAWLMVSRMIGLESAIKSPYNITLEAVSWTKHTLCND